jgi:hypothetical protein
MLGWNISIFRQTDGGSSPATVESVRGTRLAVWQTGLRGLDWIDAFVKTGKAIDLGGNGYPNRYTAIAENLIPHILDEPPAAHLTWVCEKNDVLSEKWEGKTVIDRAVVATCRPDEWLMIEAWDES